jgi:hypothetical protein
METTHTHPNPTLNRLTQYAALTLTALLAFGEVGLILLSLRAGGGFILMGITLVLFAPFLLMQTVNTPAVTVSGDGITLQPLLWKPIFVAWEAIRKVKPYPLLPPPEAETLRKVMVGRLKYRPAEGVLLVIPSLPLLYRLHGFFCGEGFTGAIALTNRTHTDYTRLVEQVENHSKRTQ